MKLFNVTTVYPAYTSSFYHKHRSNYDKSYIEQKEALIYDGCIWFDCWHHALMPYGYHVEEALSNIYPLQSAWAKECKFQYSQKNWQKEIVVEQIRKFGPDILFLEDWAFFSSREVVKIRQLCPSIHLVVSWCGASYKDANIFKAHDLVLSCIPELVEEFRALGHKSEHIHHAFDPRILERLPEDFEVDIDVSFVGQIERGSQKHQSRERLLEHLAPQLPLQIFTPSANLGLRDEIKAALKRSIYEVGNTLKRYGIPESRVTQLPILRVANNWTSPPTNPVSHTLKSYMRPPVFGLEMYQTLRKSKITLNSHIDISMNSASNMRLFESTGVGTCLVTDWKDNLPDLFIPDQEVVTYGSAEECLEKIEWLLNNPQKRQEIAKAGQQRTLEAHTFASRAARLDEILQLEFKSK